MMSMIAAGLKKIGLGLIADWFKKRWRAMGWVKAMSGLRLYSSRSDQKEWSELMNEIKTMEACFVTGHMALHESANRKKIKKLLLTDPNAQSAKRYANSFKDESFHNLVVDNTKIAQEAEIEVRWCSEFLGYSFFIADRDYEESAFIQIEFVLPGLDTSQRPSVTIKKKTYPDVFAKLVGVFDEIWSDRYSHIPFQNKDKSQFARQTTQLGKSQEDETIITPRLRAPDRAEQEDV